jgi:uncharacterized protein YbgA (DUF1722 family)
MQKVIQHLMDFLKNHLSGDDKQELLGLIEDYCQGLVPPIVPLTLLIHHLSRYPVPDWGHQQLARTVELLKGRGSDRMTNGSASML